MSIDPATGSAYFAGDPLYATGIYGPQQPADPTDQISAGDDPSFVDNAVLEMSTQWGPVDCCVGGTQFFRENAEIYLPLEPKEDPSAWIRRVSHATLAPFVTRIADQAAGLILRKPVQLTAKEEGQELDPYWEEFRGNVDGFGTDLDSYARRLAVSSLLYGHACTLVDYPSTEAAPNLAAERMQGLRPYFVNYDAKSILGWRRDESSPISPISMVRINEYVSQPLGEFGDQIVRRIRVLERDRWRVYTKGTQGQNWVVTEEGTSSLGVIPLVTTYSNKISEYISKPPLLPIADLNILHSQRNADLQFSLHVSAMPILVLAGYDDAGTEIGLSANSAILLPPEGSASYVEPASSSFGAQQAYLQMLEEQMSSLGISTLFGQKEVAETAESKRLSRTDSDSILSVISQELEESFQQCFELAAAYVGIEAPKVTVSRDFDTQSLDGNQVGQYLQLWTNGAISHETLLRALEFGEVLPGIDVEAEIEMVDQEKLGNMMMSQVGTAAITAPEAAEEEIEEETASDIRGVVEERSVVQDDEDDEDDESN